MFNTRHLGSLGAVCAILVAVAVPVAAEAGERACKSACYEQVPAPVVHKTYRSRIQEQQGVYEIAREPSLYGLATRRVLAKRDAIYRTVTVREKLPTRFVWEKRWVNGRAIMCKVRVPGEVVEREKQVLVSPARYVPTGEYAQKRVLLRPYKNIAVYHRASHSYVTERVAIQPEGYVWRRVSRRLTAD